MAFSLDRFYTVNRRALIWLILVGVLWLLRDFFALVFMTFVIAFTALSAVRLMQRHTKLPYTLSLIGVYLALLLVLATFVSLVVPNVIRETNRFAGNIGELQQTLLDLKANFLEQYPGWRRPFVGYLRSAVDETTLNLIDGQLEVEARKLGLNGFEVRRPKDKSEPDPGHNSALQQYQTVEEQLLLESLLSEMRGRFGEYIPRFINLLYRTTATLLLALLLSFLILVDWRRLCRLVQICALLGCRIFMKKPPSRWCDLHTLSVELFRCRPLSP
ncbi:MAG: AI-2E family transporter [Candidatus Competibacteraceae bacterium]|nr:AI-2E family transporter [Candidatus Competibacteraceae bacterium]